MGLEKIDTLGIMRIIGLAVLGFMLYWVFSDMELEKMELRLVPMLYVMDQELYQTKKMTVLIVPILFNLALWIPRYVGYVWIRSVLYMEGIKYICLAGYYILGSIGILIFSLAVLKSEMLLGLIMLFYLWALKTMNKTLKTEEFRKRFSVGEKTEKRIKFAALFAAAAIYAGVCGGTMIENSIQASYGMGNAEGKEAQVTTYDKIELTKKKPYGKSFMEINTYSSYVVSPDGETIILIRNNEKEQNVTIYDIKSGQLLKKMEVSDVKNVYFMPDKKYILATRYNPRQEKINKFEVRDVKTGEIDTRFKDEKGLLAKGDDRKVAYDIKVSPEGRYFVILSDGFEVWDYQRGELLDYYDIEKKPWGGEIVWLEENKFLTLKSITDRRGNLLDKEVFINEIMLDGTIKRSKQEQLAAQMKNLGILDGYIRGVRKGKEILILKGENGVFDRYSTWVNLLDVETGQVKFSLRLYNLVSILFDEKTDTIIAVEHLKSGKRKITLWSIEPKMKEETLYANVEKWEEGYLPNGADLVDKGKKLVFLKGNKIQFVNLK